MNHAANKILKDLLIQKIKDDVAGILLEYGIDKPLLSYNGDKEILIQLPFIRGQEKTQTFTLSLDMLKDLESKGYDTKLIHADTKAGLLISLFMRKQI